MTIRPAVLADAASMAAIYVSAWRSTYAGLLPDAALTRMSSVRHAAAFQAAIRAGSAVLVAEAEGRVVGFCTLGRARSPGIADGEVETLYVLDDWREHGFGRGLLLASAASLAQAGCTSLFLWVLEGNPSRFFYRRMGGKPAMRGATQVAGQSFMQVAYVWDPIGLLLTESAKL